MNPPAIGVLTALALLSVLWSVNGAPTSGKDLKTSEGHTVDNTLKLDLFLCMVARLPASVLSSIVSFLGPNKITASSLKSSFAGISFYQDALVRHVFNVHLFIGSLYPHEYFCLKQIAEAAKWHMKNSTLDLYLKHKYPLLGDIGLNLSTFQVSHPNPLMALHWLQSVHLSQTGRKHVLSSLLRLSSEHAGSDYLSHWIHYFGISPCIKTGPRSDEFERFTQLHKPEHVGAIMASDSSATLPDDIHFTWEKLHVMCNFFETVPSTHCSIQEHETMYSRNCEFISDQYRVFLDYTPRLELFNLIKHGCANIIQQQNPTLLMGFWGRSPTRRAFCLMVILINICDRPNDDYDAWMNLLGRCNVPQLERDAFFGPDRLSAESNLFAEHAEIRAGIIEAFTHLHQSTSDIPVWLWYKAMMTESTATAGRLHSDFSGVALNYFITAYRLAKMEKDKKAMERFAYRALLCQKWKCGPNILAVPMDPIFMKGLLEHPRWDFYVKYCFAYAVVHRVTEITDLVLQKLLAEYQGNSSAIVLFCQEMLSEGYIPEPYVPDFEKVTAQLMKLAELANNSH